MSTAPSQLGVLAYLSPHVSCPDVEYHVQPPSLDKFGDPLHALNAFTVSVCDLRPTLRDTTYVMSADPFVTPTITPNYLSTEEDHKMVADPLHLTRRIVAQSALAQYKPEEYLPSTAFQADEELTRAVGKIDTTTLHPIDTYRIGHADDANTVVDVQLRMRRIEGLRVVNASVMPTIISGNTNSLTIMIAEKASEMIRAAHKARVHDEATPA